MRCYTRYVLDCGMTYGLIELYAALMPCIIGYAEIAKNISKHPTPQNPYQSWIDSYSCTEYQESANQCKKTFASLYEKRTNIDTNRLQKIFNTATYMEVAFWQMGLDLS